MKRACLLIVVVMILVSNVAAGKIRVGLYVGQGGRSNGAVTWARLLSNAPEAEVHFYEGQDVRQGCLSQVDLLVMPGGRSALQAKSLGKEGREKIREYLRAGGAYFGTCAGCSIAQDCEGYLRLIPYCKSETPRRGSGMIRTDFTEEGAEKLGISPGVRAMTYHSGPLLERTFTNAVPDCHDLKILARYAGSIIENSKEPEPFPMQGRPALISAGYGKGKLIVASFHPEYYPLTHDIIAGSIRALTGHMLTLATPIKPRGSLRVGVYTPVVMGRDSYLPILELDKLRAVDVRLVDGDFIDQGELDRLDVLVFPDGDRSAIGGKTLLHGFRHAAVDRFVERGGVALSWGGMASFCNKGTRAYADAESLIAEVRRMSESACVSLQDASRTKVALIADACPTNRQVIGCQTSAKAISAAGFIPLVLPNAMDDAKLDEILGRADALVIFGSVAGEVQTRYDFERKLIHKAAERNLPVLGFCNGVQQIIIAFGGTIAKNTQNVPNAQNHWMIASTWTNDQYHAVTVKPGSLLAATIGEGRRRVNTSHRYSIQKLAPGFEVTAVADDGIIEAIEHSTKPIVGVQFHPERMAVRDGDEKALWLIADALNGVRR